MSSAPGSGRGGWVRQVEALLQATTDDLPRRALGLAGLLRGLMSGPLFACHLHGTPPAFSVVNTEGTAHQPWQQGLAELMAARAGGGDPGRAERLAAPDLAGLERAELWVIPLAQRDRRYGALAVGANGQGGTPSFLEVGAEALALLLWLEEQGRVGAAVRGELARAERLARVGELAGLIGHEFNNALNGIVLHLAVIGLEAPEKLRPELGVIRELANGAAAQVRKVQEYGRQQRAPLAPVDLNAVLAETAAWFARLAQGDAPTRAVAEVYFPDGIPAALASGAFPIEVRPAAGLPPVLGTDDDLRRLIRLLAAGAAATPGTRAVRFITDTAHNKVLLRVEEPGEAVEAGAVEKIFDPFSALRPGAGSAEPVFCKALVRRMQGSIHAEPLAEGGVAIRIELQSPTEARARR